MASDELTKMRRELYAHIVMICLLLMALGYIIALNVGWLV
jgi:hypothetical protein